MTRRPCGLVLPVALFLATAVSSQVHGQQAGACKPAGVSNPAALLADAIRAIGAGSLKGRALHLRMTDATVQDYQSDRAYPPFFLAFASRESWYQPATGVARFHGNLTFPGSEFDLGQTLSGPSATFVGGDTLRPAPTAHSAALVLRALDPWPVLYDWAASRKVTVLERCPVRDYPRIVLERAGPYGSERLALDPKTSLPVSLEREEPHYLWQLSVAYVYSNWKQEGGFSIPSSSFRMVDGAAEVSRTVASSEAIPDDSTPSLRAPISPTAMMPEPPGFLRPTAPDSVRVGTATRLLLNPGYTEAVVLVDDTLYLLDATQGEARARADSAAIERLFPGRHPIVLVVTDLAWPHIAGVRYWVARGATVVSHRISRPFLGRVLERRWTRAPDLYERRRAAARFRFRPVDDSLVLGGGKLRIYPIDGISSEGGLMVYVEGDRFLWAGDYVQTVAEPSTYATEVWRAVRRAGIQPARVAAQHLPLTEWSTVDSLARSSQGDEAT